VINIFTPTAADAAEAAILEMVNSAQRKIRVAAYGYTDTVLNDALIRKHQQGVDLKIIMDATEAQTPHQKILVDQLKKAGVDIKIGKSPVNSALLHAKFIIVDDEEVEFGSLNYSPSGLEQFNFCTFSTSPERAKQFDTAWQQIYDHISLHPMKPRFSVRSWWEQLCEWCAKIPPPYAWGRGKDE
jgi:hypothetical protein